MNEILTPRQKFDNTPEDNTTCLFSVRIAYQIDNEDDPVFPLCGREKMNYRTFPGDEENTTLHSAKLLNLPKIVINDYRMDLYETKILYTMKVLGVNCLPSLDKITIRNNHA